MKILWVSHFLPWPPTGHGALQRSHNLLIEAAREHEVHLAALAVPNAHPTPEAVDDALRELAPKVASAAAFAIPHDALGLRRAGAAVTALAGGAGFWERRLWSPSLAAHVRTLSGAVSFDLVHLDIVFLKRYLRGLGTPLVLNHHNIESDLLLRRAAMPGAGAKRWFFGQQAVRTARLERELAREARMNLTVSELDRDRLRDVAGAVPTTVIANGVDVQFFSPDPSVTPDGDALVFAGGMDWFPNREAMEYLAGELWPALHADRSARRMTVIGRNPPPALLAAATHEPSLRVAGFVDDVRPYLDAAAIYLCPIRVGGGTRLKILDALSMSKALVSTSLGVEGLGLVDGEHYLRADSVAETLVQVRRLEADPALRDRLGRAGRRLVEERYSWRTIGRELLAAYARAASAHPDAAPSTTI
ncbi:MAG TPA: glycosyltransferase [Gemmatimonadaceae bacterium]|nr:glycosyltransferase [Gemmatimonadaceae bacterium]